MTGLPRSRSISGVLSAEKSIGDGSVWPRKDCLTSKKQKLIKQFLFKCLADVYYYDETGAGTETETI